MWRLAVEIISWLCVHLLLRCRSSPLSLTLSLVSHFILKESKKYSVVSHFCVRVSFILTLETHFKNWFLSAVQCDAHLMPDCTHYQLLEQLMCCQRRVWFLHSTHIMYEREYWHKSNAFFNLTLFTNWFKYITTITIVFSDSTLNCNKSSHKFW